MQEQSILRLTMSATVPTNEWEKLEALMAEARVAIPKEGDGVLIHECHYNPATQEIFFLETYANETALMMHAQEFTPILNTIKVDWKIKRINLLGNYSDEIFDMFKGMAQGAEVNLYKKVFKSK
jgi:hypothetical protein